MASLRAQGGMAALNISHVAYPTREFTSPSGKVEFHSSRAARSMTAKGHRTPWMHSATIFRLLFDSRRGYSDIGILPLVGRRTECR